jgi:ribosomal protein L11 methyltransferase
VAPTSITWRSASDSDLAWLSVDLEVAAHIAGELEAALLRIGALSVTFSDPGAEPILEPGAGEIRLWPRVLVSALLPRETPRTLLQRQLASVFPSGVLPPVTVSELARRDWVRDWQSTLAPLRVGRRLWICPPEQGCPEPGAVAIRLEPGLAFGTGGHATTALCLDWLAGTDLAGRTVLDWGCGSGVLAIAALALGARSATALDTDGQALQATRANAQRNNCSDRLEALEPSALDPQARFDVVVANILADTLIDIAPQLRRHCRAGATVAMSGILATQAARVQQACASRIRLHVHSERDGWVLLAGASVLIGP